MRPGRIICMLLIAAAAFTALAVGTAAADTGSAAAASEEEISFGAETFAAPDTEEEETDAAVIRTVKYTVTFDLGDSVSKVSVAAGESVPEADIPTADAAGNAVIRWYYEDYSAETDPAALEITEDITLKAWFAPALRQQHDAFMTGYGSGTFGPDDRLTRAQTAQILYNLLETPAVGAFPCTYTDVSEEEWYYDAVTVTSSLGLFDCDGGAFLPDAVITRGEFVDVVTRLVVRVTADNPFPDVSESDPYYAAILTAYAMGWVEGMDDGTFSPDGPLTRAQAAKIFEGVLDRTADRSVIYSGSSVRSFTDVAPESWYYPYVLEATVDHTAGSTGAGETWTDYTRTIPVTFVVDGSQNTVYVYPGDRPAGTQIPTANASGTAIARWTVTGYNTMADPYTLTVTEEVSYTAWYAPKLASDHTAYVVGYSGGTFRPDGELTRAEACQMLYSLLAVKSHGYFWTSFADVTEDDWYYEAVTTLASLDIITATGLSYGPDQIITRGEFADMIAKLTALSHTANSYSDVDDSSPYYYAISTATDQGWLEGMGDGTFGVNSPLTRAQAVAVFNRMTGRYGDSSAEKAMDSRYTFSDVSTSHWAYVYIMEAATPHVYTVSGTKETWSSYSHADAGTVNWESSDSVVSAASILLNISSTYAGDYTQNYNVDYSDSAKENFVNSSGYSSKTGYLIWISRACQKVYIFQGAKGSWKLQNTFICATGAPQTPTPVGVTYITYKESAWYFDHYTVFPVVRFYPGTGYAFHSRLYKIGSTTQYVDDSIGYPVSQGCCRMLASDITYIYNKMPLNTTVVIY